jgi:hypothetical protein
VWGCGGVGDGSNFMPLSTIFLKPKGFPKIKSFQHY